MFAGNARENRSSIASSLLLLLLLRRSSTEGDLSTMDPHRAPETRAPRRSSRLLLLLLFLLLPFLPDGKFRHSDSVNESFVGNFVVGRLSSSGNRIYLYVYRVTIKRFQFPISWNPDCDSFLAFLPISKDPTRGSFEWNEIGYLKVNCISIAAGRSGG